MDNVSKNTSEKHTRNRNRPNRRQAYESGVRDYADDEIQQNDICQTMFNEVSAAKH